MGQVLYRKYRSKRLSEIIGQEHITRTLQEALKQGRISHAYLFTGPKGVGKTSIARILAHEINDLAYKDDSSHIDIIEIDAASNRRIDEIRELRDKVYVAPTSSKYKVYIIDEVHMLTREAFNALLKTLEEPPEHAVFILATTDAHKLPETIISRTQRFTFKPVEKAKVVKHLKEIAKKEKIQTTDEALELLADHGEGSFRDSISLLDQARSHGQKLDAEAVHTLLGIPPTSAIKNLYHSLAGNSSSDVLRQLNNLYEQGYQASAIAKELAHLLRAELTGDQLSLPSETIFKLLRQLIETPAAYNPEHFLEINLLESLSTDRPVVAAKAVKELDETAPEVEEQPLEQLDEPKPAAGKNSKSKSSNLPLDENLWQAVLQTLKQRHNTLYGVVRMAEPTFKKDGSLELSFAFAFHQKRLKESGNRQLLTDIIKELTGKQVAIDCNHDKTAKPPKTAVVAAETSPPADIKAISNIFGGAELLES